MSVEIKSFREVIIDGKPVGTLAEAIANHSARAGEIAEAALAWDTEREAATVTAKAERDAAVAERDAVYANIVAARTEAVTAFQAFSTAIDAAQKAGEDAISKIATKAQADEIARQKALAEATKAKEEAEAKIAELSK